MNFKYFLKCKIDTTMLRIFCYVSMGPINNSQSNIAHLQKSSFERLFSVALPCIFCGVQSSPFYFDSKKRIEAQGTDWYSISISVKKKFDQKIMSKNLSNKIYPSFISVVIKKMGKFGWTTVYLYFLVRYEPYFHVGYVSINEFFTYH